MGANKTKPERKILLVGKTGDGKSSAGNLILKKQIFLSESSPTSSTKDLDYGTGVVYGRHIKVIDTPGLLETSDDEENIRKKLIQSLVDSAPGPFVLTIVLKVGRYTKQEEKIEKKIWEYFEEIDANQSLVLFTHGEDLDGQTIEEFVKKSAELQELVDKCGGRCHVIDSKHWNNRIWGYRSNRVQVKNLLKTIDKMVMRNSSYTNELLQIVEEEIQREIHSSDPNLSQEERRERAKKTVFEKLAIRFAGVATGTLVGALMGLAVPVQSLVALIKGVRKAFSTDRDAQPEKTSASASTCNMTEDMEEANAEETGVTAAVFGATAGAAIGNSAAMEAGLAAVGTAGGPAAALGAAAAAAVGGTAATAGGPAAGGAVTSLGAAAGGPAAKGAVAAGGAAAVGTAVSVVAAVVEAAGVTTAAVGAATVEAGIISGATVGAVAVEAGVAAGAVAVEAGAAGAGIGVAAGSGIAAGVIFGAAALAGAIGGGVTGYRAADEADSVLDVIKITAKANYENAKGVVEKAEELATNIKQCFVGKPKNVY